MTSSKSSLLVGVLPNQAKLSVRPSPRNQSADLHHPLTGHMTCCCTVAYHPSTHTLRLSMSTLHTMLNRMQPAPHNSNVCTLPSLPSASLTPPKLENQDHQGSLGPTRPHPRHPQLASVALCTTMTLVSAWSFAMRSGPSVRRWLPVVCKTNKRPQETRVL